MSKILLSKRQLKILVSGHLFGSAPLLISSSVATFAGPDAWLSVIFAGIAGLLVIWIDTYLGGLYPEKTLVEIMFLLLGKWLGGFVAVCYIFIALLTGTQVIWYVGDFFTTVFEPEYPSYPINTLFIAIIAIALLYGLEAMSRATEIFFLFGFPVIILSALTLIPQMKVNNVLPMLEKGLVPVLRGAIPLLNFTVLPFIFLNMVFPVHTGNIKDAKKNIYKGYLLGITTVFIAVIMCILTLGSAITANLRFPLFISTRLIRIGEVFSRIEALIVFIWIITNFVAAFFYIYAGVVGLSQVLKLKSYKSLVLPLLLIISAYSDIIYTNVPYEMKWDILVWTPTIFTVGLILPLMLLIIAMIKKAKEVR